MLSGFREAGKLLGIISDKADDSAKSIEKVQGKGFFAGLTESTFGAGPLANATGGMFSGGGGGDAAGASQGGKPSAPSEVTKGMSDITGGGPQQKVFNIHIAKFQDTVQFVTETVGEGVEQSQAMFEEMLLRVLNGVQAKQ